MKHSQASICLLLLIVLAILSSTLIAAFHICSLRGQIIVASIKNQQLEKLCSSMGDLGVILAKQERKISPEARTLFYTVPLPDKMQGYIGYINISLDEQASTIEAAVWQEGVQAKALTIVMQHKASLPDHQILQWKLSS